VHFLARICFARSLIDFLLPLYFPGQAEYGPFKPNFPTEVPLWLAIDLKRKKRCKIQPPAWLSVGMISNRMPSKYRLLQSIHVCIEALFLFSR
jgi:hypothetical protein